MDAAPILLPSPRKSPFQVAYAHEIHDESSAEEEEEHYSYDPSPDEAVFDEDSQEDSQDASSPHTSDDDLSTIPPDLESRAPSTIYTPHKRRSPFRHPSSVRNIQLDTTPPHLVSPHRRQYQLASGSRNGTPNSRYSSHSRPQSARSSPSKKPKVKKEHPLVLLHLTLLPLSLPYSQSLLETVLPPKKLADCKLLKEKLGESVIQERGVLIPHPKDEYDLLEERLLEALELEQGPLSRDGHFLLPEEREVSRSVSRSTARMRLASEDILEEEEEEHVMEDDDDGRTEVADSHLCQDCGKHVETICSERRWDIRVYAANGLMREGAWNAAWREMERVDVEIKPFISDQMKRELENRWEDMELLLSTGSKESLVVPTDEVVHQSIERDEDDAVQSPAALSPTPAPEENRMMLSNERLKEIYGHHADAKIESLKEDTSSRYPTTQEFRANASTAEIPITTLLANYIRLLVQDRRNVALICLSTVIVFMATQIAHPQLPQADLYEAVLRPSVVASVATPNATPNIAAHVDSSQLRPSLPYDTVATQEIVEGEKTRSPHPVLISSTETPTVSLADPETKTSSSTLVPTASSGDLSSEASSTLYRVAEKVPSVKLEEPNVQQETDGEMMHGNDLNERMENDTQAERRDDDMPAQRETREERLFESES